MIQSAALIISEKLKINGFRASAGWLQAFKKRHDLVVRKLVGESASANLLAAKDFLLRFPELIKGYKKEIFNCDETGLFYKLLPDKSFMKRESSANNTKKDKNRISVLLCFSMKGEKLDPVFIGKSKMPRT
jgi:hypothetical protein